MKSHIFTLKCRILSENSINLAWFNEIIRAYKIIKQLIIIY